MQSYSPHQDIITWAQDVKKKLNIVGKDNKVQKDLVEDYQYIDRMLGHV